MGDCWKSEARALARFYELDLGFQEVLKRFFSKLGLRGGFGIYKLNQNLEDYLGLKVRALVGVV